MLNNLMQKCIDLAKLGEGKVSPNPLVGAVVLDKDGFVVGEGYHEKYGEAHAETNALNQAGDKARGGTLIVNLEPCSHFGKTPPCADLIVERGIKKLIVGMVDPNPVVSGKGLQKCLEAGIEVKAGILEDECKELNEVFIVNQIEKRPFIAIKIATTIDGKIATKTGSSKWITSEKSRELVQKFRNRYDAILTGSGTVMVDNPSMLCTMPGGKNPIKIVLDTNAQTSPSAKIFEEGRVILATKAAVIDYPDNVEILVCPQDETGKVDLNFLINALWEKGIRSILVEAGARVNSSFVRQGLADKLYHFIAPKILGDTQAISCFEGFNVTEIQNCINLTLKDVKKVGNDVLMTYV